MTEELELKYAIDEPAAVRRWLDAEFPALTAPDADAEADAERWTSQTITDRYFDTADGVLAERRYGARLRRVGGRTTLTLKSDIEVDGALHRREELEAPASKALDVSRWPDSTARRRLLELVGDARLIERFSVRVRRRTRLLHLGDAVVEASIDEGRAETWGVDAGPLRQLEFELKSGSRDGIATLARVAEASGLARPEPRSKLVIAAEMAAEAGRVRPEDEFAEAGRKVLRRHLVRMLEREVATRAGDELGLKQMRVATRRMRASWRVFADAYRKPVRRRFTDDLRELGRSLGAVRDLDVLIAAFATDARLAGLVTHWHAARLTALDELHALLDTDLHGRFVGDSLEFLAKPGEGATRAGRTRVGRRAGAALEAAYERVLAAGATAQDQDDDESWHNLRIETRRFRYSLEAFADVTSPDPAGELHRRAVRVQDHLGEINDASVSIDAVSTWLAGAEGVVGREAQRAAAEYVARLRGRITKQRNGFAPVWADLSDGTARELLSSALEPLTRR